MAKKANPRPERRDVRRTILESARKRFLLDGFRKTTIESIALDQHVSKKSIYALFDSKPAIWHELVRIEARKTVEYLKTHLPAELPPLARLEKLIGFYLRRRLQANAEARARKLASSPAVAPPEETSKLLREEALQHAFPLLVEDLIREYQSSVTQTVVQEVARTSTSATDPEAQPSPSFSDPVAQPVAQTSTSATDASDYSLLTSMVVGAVVSASDFPAMSADVVSDVCEVVKKMVQHE